MKFKNQVKFLLIFSIFALFSVSAVCADDLNSTDTVALNDADDTLVSGTDLDKVAADDVEKQIPEISVNSTTVTTGDSIKISLKDSDNASLVNKNLTAIINDETYNFVTDENGSVILKLGLPAKSYVLQVIFSGDNDYFPITQNFTIDVSKQASQINPVDTAVVSGDYFYIYLNDGYGKAINGTTVTFVLNGITYNVNTDSKGRAGIKVSLAAKTYSLKITFAGNDYYNSVSTTINIIVRAATSIVIGNSILLTNGYLRIYLKCSNQALISNKNVKITINNKVYTKKTNSEGIIVFKPMAGTGTISVKVEFATEGYLGGSSAQKQVTGIKGDPKSPLTSKIPLKNGVPNVDYMLGSYVMGDGDMSYTLTKAQYKNVIKRDSYCLYLYNKLSKYTFFKSKSEPKLKHIISREKWNVIERAINTKIVKKNKKNYWPSQITVSLKGKSYTYSEVRDVQNTGYTCGPTSTSMCSQALRNYYCESYLAKLAGSTYSEGSSSSGLKKAMEKCHFSCKIYHKSSFKTALNQLKKGGCALVFHTWNHYVSILDISKDGKKVLVGNPSGNYNKGSHGIPTNWLTVSYMKKCFNNYDTSGLIVKLKYSLSKTTKSKVKNFYSSMGTKWSRQNTAERIPQI